MSHLEQAENLQEHLLQTADNCWMLETAENLLKLLLELWELLKTQMIMASWPWGHRCGWPAPQSHKQQEVWPLATQALGQKRDSWSRREMRLVGRESVPHFPACSVP